jgi:hypothetical protein
MNTLKGVTIKAESDVGHNIAIKPMNILRLFELTNILIKFSKETQESISQGC